MLLLIVFELKSSTLYSHKNGVKEAGEMLTDSLHNISDIIACKI